MIILITSNSNKAQEIQEMIGQPVYTRTLDIPEIQSSDLDDIVIAKAKSAFDLLDKEQYSDDLSCLGADPNLSVLVEDSALSFDALGGLPGPFIKFFYHQLGNTGLIKLLSPYDNQGVAQCTFGLYNGKGSVQLFRGSVPGQIVSEPRGSNGFAWDPIFQPTGSSNTFAEMTSQEKNAHSPRYEALKQLANYFSQSQV